MKRLILFFFLCGFSAIAGAQPAGINKTDEKGRKQGYWEKTDPQTKMIAYRGKFKDDKPAGTFYYYYKGTDSVHTKMDFRPDGKSAYAKLYYLNGKLQAQGKYVNEQKDSSWNFYDEAGKLISTEGYAGGKKNGLSKIFFPDGKLSEEKNYKDGLLEGPFKTYFNEKDVKSEGTNKNNNYQGKCTWFYPNGVAAAQGVYDNGNKKGLWIYKEQDGKIKEKEVWVNGAKLEPKETEEYLKNKAAVSEQPQQKVKETTRPGGGKK